MPCPREKCRRSKTDGYLSSTRTLGRRCHRKPDVPGQDIALKSVWHKCDTCNIKQSVGLYNPLFCGFLGKGSKGISYAVMAFWNCAEGVPVSKSVRQLELSEVTVQALYDRTTIIMAA